MFENIMNMTKMTMKLLLRNKGFLFFCIIIPIVATLLLNINLTTQSTTTESKICEIDNMNDQIAYLSEVTKFPVKVYDSSHSDLTDTLLEELAGAGIFQIYRVDSSDYTSEEIASSAQQMAMKDKIGAILIIGPDFEKQLTNGKVDDCITVYKTSDDERYDAFENSLRNQLSTYASYGSMNGTKLGIEQAIEEARKQLPKENIIEVQVKRTTGIDHIDYARTNNFGSTLAVVTLSSVFTGIMILGTILKEKQNLVFTRILLSDSTVSQYIASKFMIIVLADVLQTLIMALTFQFFVKADVCITLPQFMLISFLMGLIFTSVSISVGLICNSVLSACYAAFLIWVISALTSGLYFDMSNSSQWFKQIALFMPQRWALKAAQMFMDGSSQTYPMIFSVTAAYLIVILVIGAIGIKLTNRE